MTQRILGIDPGYGRMGWGLIEGSGRDWVYIAHGCVETNADDTFIDRLHSLSKELKDIIERYKPTKAAVEDLFFAKNAKTAMKVGQARGVILLCLIESNLDIDEFTPLQVKSAVTGYGSAEKQQVQKLVQMSLGMREFPSQDDAADALGVALTSGLTSATF